MSTGPGPDPAPDDDLPFDPAALHARVARVLPAAAGLPAAVPAGAGTDNRMLRLGPDLVLRVPRRPSAVALLRREMRILHRLAGLPLAVPLLVAALTEAEPPAALLRWIEGEPARPAALRDPAAAARALAAFLTALRALPADDGPATGEANHLRGVPLSRLDSRVGAALATLADEIDAPAAHRLWAAARAAPGPGLPAWLHGDLRADNLLARSGTLAGVIDFGLAAVGDPAADTAAAWTWVPAEARPAFREALGAGPAEWARARGWALHGAAVALAFYRGGRNPALAAAPRRTLRALGLA